MLKFRSQLNDALIVVAMVSACVVSVAAGDKEGVFKGEISDSQCAYNVHSTTHSHAEMLKTHTMGNSPADCVRICVEKLGGLYVLRTKDKVYKLDKQNLADKYPAQAVIVTGVLNSKRDTIVVQSIVPSTAE